MKLRKRLSAYKKCPRCGNKCLKQQETCEDCGLVFARLQYASNKAAKRKIRHFDKDFVIYTNQYPSDMSWWKLILLTFLTGIVGGHYYYVGKYWKGGFMTAGFIYLVFCTIFNAQMVDALTTYYAYLPIGILGISWIASLIYVACKKFKVPVIVEVPEQIVVEEREKFFAEVDAALQEKKASEKKASAKKSKNKKQEKTEVAEEEKKDPAEKLSQQTEKKRKGKKKPVEVENPPEHDGEVKK